MITRPIENCYWVILGKLLAGEYPRNVDEESSRPKLAALTGAGISAFIDLTKEGDLPPTPSGWKRRPANASPSLTGGCQSPRS